VVVAATRVGETAKYSHGRALRLTAIRHSLD
jgi:hypothetical protein